MRNKPVVLITGSAQGIGFDAARRLAKEGYAVVATYRSLNPELIALAKIYPNNVFLRELDVVNNNQNSIITLVKNIEHEIGPIGILINNAGLGIIGPTESLTEDQIRKIFETNVMGPVKVTNAVLPSMRERNSGKIINISSIVGPMPSLNQCFYSGSKAMLEHYGAQLRKDLEVNGYNGIVVTNVNPGPVVTNFVTAAVYGARFEGKEDPYPKTKMDNATWRVLMKDGRPVSETTDTIVSVINNPKPAFWNPTEKRVAKNFARIYDDPSGEEFSRGPVLAAKL